MVITTFRVQSWNHFRLLILLIIILTRIIWFMSRQVCLRMFLAHGQYFPTKSSNEAK